MNLKQLHYFVSVAEHGCISGAAAASNVAQSAISSQIANLEAELGTQLFARHARGVALTPPGRVLLDHARQIRAQLEEAKREVGEAAALRGELAIGIPVSIASVLTLPLMEAIEERLPHLQVRVYEALTGDLRAWLRSGKVETALLYGRDDAEDLEIEPLADDELVLYGLAHAPEARRRRIAFKDLPGYPLFLTDNDHPTRPLLVRLAQAEGIVLRFAAQINSVHQLKALAREGRGHTILPLVALAGEHAEAGGLIHPFSPMIKLRSYVAGLSKTRPHAASLRRIIRDVACDLIGKGIWPGARMVELVADDGGVRAPRRPPMRSHVAP